MADTTYFSSKTFAFLRDLASHNHREWFQENKERYEEDVRVPALRFIQDFAPYLEGLSPHFRADPRKSGGSLFRIHRDIRFSKDKSPYKTHTGIQFRHEAGRDAHAPGFYLHMEPGGCFAGVGIWRPDASTLRKIREHLLEDPGGWKEVAYDGAFQERYGLSGERLVRPPRGFDPQHTLVEDLKWKDFVGMAEIPEEEITSPGFLQEYAGYCRTGLPFVSFLCRALGLPV